MCTRRKTSLPTTIPASFLTRAIRRSASTDGSRTCGLAGSGRSTVSARKGARKGSFFWFQGPDFLRIALCNTSRNSQRFCHRPYICDPAKCLCRIALPKFGLKHFDTNFRVANAESIASYWYDGRVQALLLAGTRPAAERNEH